MQKLDGVVVARVQGDPGDRSLPRGDPLADQRRLAEAGRGGEEGERFGEALGEVAGNALRWRYVLALPVDGKVYNVDFDDWMFLVDERVMLNRAAMSKFGIHLGEVTLAFTKR